jgi:Ca-activated chloride channel family protein
VSLLVPTALLAGLLAVPILLLYMLKLRRRQVQVSSTLLWQMLLRDRQANTPWQRLKRNLLLFLQLLILAALVFALARPALKVPSVAGGSLVVLLDGSASMNAYNLPSSGSSGQSGTLQSSLQRQGNQTRFETARADVRNLIYSLPEDSRMT